MVNAANVSVKVYSEDETAAVYRKIAWRLVPILMLCYVAAYLDRVNIGFAKLQMLSELQFSETIYGLGAGVFFIGYFLFEVPSNIILRKIGARVWIARIMITWGIISSLFMFVTTPLQFYILRFLLGAAEAGFYPGVILYLTFWFPSSRRSRIIALFMTAIPVSGILGGPISGWIMSALHGYHGWSGWKWMFLLEAIPSVVIGIITLFYLTNKPSDAKWLSDHEKRIVEQGLDRLDRNSDAIHSIGGIFKDPRVLHMCVIYFCVIMGQYGLTFWMPTLIKAAGISGVLNIGLFTAIPYSFAVVAMLLFASNSDRTGERRWHLIVPMAMGATGYAIAAWAGGDNIVAALVGLSLAAAGAVTPGALFWAVPSSFMSGAGAAAGIATINAVAGLAGFVSPYLVGWLRDLTHSSTIGMYVSAGVLIFGALAVLKVPTSVNGKH
jgi:D-galactonate transporter